jgi:hypothetical protein
MFVVSGLRTPMSLDLTETAEPRKGLPPPNIHSLLAITAEPGALMPVGRSARCAQVLAAMS